MEDKNIPVLSIEEIKKIDVFMKESEVKMIQDLFSSIDIRFKYKALLLCAYIMDVDPNEVLIKNAGRKMKLSPEVFIARYMWFTILCKNYSTSEQDVTELCDGFNYSLIRKGIAFFNDKITKSPVLNSKYNTVLSILYK